MIVRDGLSISPLVPKIPVNFSEHALIAVSPYNSFYSKENIERLINWAQENFKNFNVFTMDGAFKYNLMALGYSEVEATKKMNKQDNHLRNKIIACLNKAGFKTEEAEGKIIHLNNITGNKRYLELYRKYIKLFQNNLRFQYDCLNASRNFLTNKIDVISEKSLNLAVEYILLELPLWFETPYILHLPTSVFLYKDMPLFWRNICYNYGLLSSKQKILIMDTSCIPCDRRSDTGYL